VKIKEVEAMTTKETTQMLCSIALDTLDEYEGNVSAASRALLLPNYALQKMLNGNQMNYDTLITALDALGYEIVIRKKEEKK
jgi:hypothetical protein